MAVGSRQHVLQPAYLPTVKSEACCAMHTDKIKAVHKGGGVFSEGS